MVDMRKTFGPLVALDGVSLDVPAGSFHALLGENGAGEVDPREMHHGRFLSAGPGKILVDGAEAAIPNPRRAHAVGIGLVHQNFVLVPSLTGAENLIISRNDVPQVINWGGEKSKLRLSSIGCRSARP